MFDIEVGDHVRVVLPGVAAWAIPAQNSEARATAENIDELIADAREQVELGGARLYVNDQLVAGR